MNKIPTEKIAKMLDLYRAGNRIERIAADTEVSYCSAFRIISLYRDCKAQNWKNISKNLSKRYYHQHIFDFILLEYLPYE